MDCTLRGAAREDGRGYSPLVGLQPPCQVTQFVMEIRLSNFDQ